MNEYEARQRSIKSFRIARVLVRLVEHGYDVETLGDPTLTTPVVRARVAEIAGVHPPSDLTWSAALDWLRVFDERSG